MKLGDKIASVATPIARTLHMGCIDPETKQLRPESRCNQTRMALNDGRYWDAFFIRFFGKQTQTQETNKMIYLVQLAVEADDVRAAVEKIPPEFPIRSVMPGPPTPLPQSTPPPQPK